MNLIKSAV